MTRLALAFAAAFALVSAAPAFAEPCKDCPMHKEKVAAADKADKKDAKKCACGKDPKDCKCAAGKCDCHKAEKKDEGKKS